MGNGRCELIDVRTGQSMLRFDNTLGGPAAFSPDGHRLALADGGVVTLHDATPRTGFDESPRRDVASSGWHPAGIVGVCLPRWRSINRRQP